MSRIDVQEGDSERSFTVRGANHIEVGFESRNNEEGDAPIKSAHKDSLVPRTFRRRRVSPVKVNYLNLNSKKTVQGVRRSQISLLVVDDDPDQLSFYSSILRRAGFRVFEVEKAAEARKLLEKTFIDVVICDVNLPHLEGLELLKKLREMRTIPQDAKIPIIVQTTGGEEIQVKASNFGADGFCYKEEHPKRLLEEVEALVNC